MHTLKASKETLDALHKHVPGLADAADDDKLARVAQHLQTMSDADMTDAGIDGANTSSSVQAMSAADIHAKALENRKAWKEAADELPTLKQERDTAVQKLTDAEARVQTMSKANEQAKAYEPDPIAVKMMSRSMDTEKAACIASGAVDKATADAIDGLLRDKGKPTILAMSKAGDDLAGFKVWEILRANKPRVMASQTGVQAMSRADPDSGTPDNADLKTALQTMQAAANGK